MHVTAYSGFPQFYFQNFSSFLIRYMVYQLPKDPSAALAIEPGVAGFEGVANPVPTAGFAATGFAGYGFDEIDFVILDVTTTGAVAIIGCFTMGCISSMIGCTSSMGIWVQSHTRVTGLCIHS